MGQAENTELDSLGIKIMVVIAISVGAFVVCTAIAIL